MSAAELASVLWALARLHHTPDGAWVSAFWAAADGPQLATAGADTLSSLLWAAADLDLVPPAAWLEHAFLPALDGPRLLSLVPTTNAVSVISSLAKLGARPPGGWMQRYLGHVAGMLAAAAERCQQPAAAAVSAADAATSAVAAGVAPSGRFASSLPPSLFDQVEPEDCLALLRALIGMNVVLARGGPMMDSLCTVLQRRLPDLAPSAAVQLLADLALLGHVPPPAWMKDFYAAVLMRLPPTLDGSDDDEELQVGSPSTSGGGGGGAPRGSDGRPQLLEIDHVESILHAAALMQATLESLPPAAPLAPGTGDPSSLGDDDAIVDSSSGRIDSEGPNDAVPLATPTASASSSSPGAPQQQLGGGGVGTDSSRAAEQPPPLGERDQQAANAAAAVQPPPQLLNYLYSSMTSDRMCALSGGRITRLVLTIARLGTPPDEAWLRRLVDAARASMAAAASTSSGPDAAAGSGRSAVPSKAAAPASSVNAVAAAAGWTPPQLQAFASALSAISRRHLPNADWLNNFVAYMKEFFLVS